MNPAYGGPSQGIRNSIPVLLKIGVHTEVVTLDNPDEAFLMHDAFSIHALGKGVGPWSYNPSLVPWLYSNIKRFDVVILHGLWLYYSFALYKVMQKLKKDGSGHYMPKFLIMPHGMLDPWFQLSRGRKLKAIRNSIYWQLIEHKVINNADGILFTCEQELLLARQTFPNYYPKKELNVGYGIAVPPAHNVDMDLAFYEVCPQVQNCSYMLFLSRINVKKGIDLLIKTYLELKLNGFSLPKLVIAGPGLDTAYGKEMQRLAAVDKEIYFPGMLMGNAKWGAFYNCSAFVLPSHQENFGIALVEAMACGKPVLITNQINIWREIENEKGGIVENDTFEGIYQLLGKFSKLSVDERQKLSKNALHTYKNHFDVNVTSMRLYHTIKSVVEIPGIGAALNNVR